jgi:hypothetical protein
VKRRLSKPSLASMKLSFAGQQALAEELLCQLQAPALCEVAVVSDENVAYEVRMVEEVKLLWPELEQNDVAVIACKTVQEANRIATKFG